MKLKSLLDSSKISYEVMEHDAVFTSEEAAKTRGTELKQGVKALIVKTDNSFVQCNVPADSELNLEKVKGITKSQTVGLATASEVKKVTDCSIGSVPPFGNLFSIPVYIDTHVKNNEIVAFNAGSHTKSIKMKAEDLIAITKAHVVDIKQ
jgi:Ala-tRNA(Pro) deacylase